MKCFYEMFLRNVVPKCFLQNAFTKCFYEMLLRNSFTKCFFINFFTKCFYEFFYEMFFYEIFHIFLALPCMSNKAQKNGSGKYMTING